MIVFALFLGLIFGMVEAEVVFPYHRANDLAKERFFDGWHLECGKDTCCRKNYKLKYFYDLQGLISIDGKSLKDLISEYNSKINEKFLSKELDEMRNIYINVHNSSITANNRPQKVQIEALENMFLVDRIITGIINDPRLLALLRDPNLNVQRSIEEHFGCSLDSREYLCHLFTQEESSRKEAFKDAVSRLLDLHFNVNGSLREDEVKEAFVRYKNHLNYQLGDLRDFRKKAEFIQSMQGHGVWPPPISSLGPSEPHNNIEELQIALNRIRRDINSIKNSHYYKMQEIEKKQILDKMDPFCSIEGSVRQLCHFPFGQIAFDNMKIFHYVRDIVGELDYSVDTAEITLPCENVIEKKSSRGLANGSDFSCLNEKKFDETPNDRVDQVTQINDNISSVQNTLFLFSSLHPEGLVLSTAGGQSSLEENLEYNLPAPSAEPIFAINNSSLSTSLSLNGAPEAMQRQITRNNGKIISTTNSENIGRDSQRADSTNRSSSAEPIFAINNSSLSTTNSENIGKDSQRADSTNRSKSGYETLEDLTKTTLDSTFKSCVMRLPENERPSRACLSRSFFDKCFTGYLVRNKNRYNCDEFYIGPQSNRHQSPECRAYMNTPYSAKISNCYYNVAKKECKRSLDNWYQQNSVWKNTTVRERIGSILNIVEEKTNLLKQSQAHAALDSSIVSCIAKAEHATNGVSENMFFPETVNYSFCRQSRYRDGRPFSSAQGITQMTCNTFYDLRRRGILPLQGLPDRVETAVRESQSPSSCLNTIPSSEEGYFREMGSNPSMQIEGAVRYINHLLKVKSREDLSPDEIVELAVRSYDSDNPVKYKANFLACRQCLIDAVKKSQQEKIRCFLK